MKLRLPRMLRSAVVAAVTAAVYATLGSATCGIAAQAEETGRTLHVYILTGQSNSLGAVKGDPASADTLAYYSTVKDGDADGIRMWDGNMAGSLSDPTTGGLAWNNEGKAWMTVQPQATPAGNGSHGAAGTPYETMTGNADLRNAWEGNKGNGVMGPEYGFAYMMQKKGWNVGAGDDVAVIKVSRDGGSNSNWVKPATPGSVNGYTFLLDSVKEALAHVDPGSYDSVVIDGLMYLQGESDKTAAEITGAQQRYQAFIENLKNDLTAAGITAEVSLAQSVAGEPANWKGTDTVAGGTTTAKELLALARNNENVGYVYTRDLGKITSGDDMGVHYDGNSEITIGARYAYAMAAEQGMDLTEKGTVRVRSQAYGDAQLNESAVSLNEARAWWQGRGDAVAYSAESMAGSIAVWDVSSAAMGAASTGAETLSADLTVKGIRIEDPYADDDTVGTHNATVTVKNAAGADATLSVGAAGIELQRGNLNLQTKTATTAAQTWTVAGGKTLAVGNSIGGADAVALRKHADIAAAAAARFDFSAATDAGHRTWSLGDGVEVALSDNGFAQSTLAVEESASAALAGGRAGIGTLSLGEGASLDLAAGLTLTADCVSLGNTATLTFNYNGGQFSALNAGTLTAGDNAVVTVNLGNASNLSRAEFTLGTGWSGWTVASESGNGRVLTLASAPAGYHLSVDGTGALVLSGVPTYPDVQKTWVQTPAGAVVTAQNNMEAVTSALPVAGSDTAVAVLVNGTGGSDWLLYGGGKASVGAGKALYTEMQVQNARFVSNVGTFSSGDRSTVAEGDYNMKIADGASFESVFAASNITVRGNVYTELDAADAVYRGTQYGVVGAFGADVSGDVTLVVNGGTFNSNVNVWGSRKNGSTVNNLGDLSIEVNGGSLQNIYVSDAAAHHIKSAKVILNGGTVNGSVYGSNTGVVSEEGSSVYIGAAAVVKGDIYGGTAGNREGLVTLHDMEENAAFLTNFSSGKGIYADRLVLDNTVIGNSFNGTFHANSVSIGEGSSLAASKLAEGALAGKGTYVLAAGTQALPANVSLAEDWAGTVKLSGSISNLDLANAALGHANSAIELNSVSGGLAAVNTAVDADVVLSGSGLTLSAVSGSNTYTFNGSVSGEGGIKRTNDAKNNNVVSLVFKGDVSDWTGNIIMDRANVVDMNVTFRDDAKVINASLSVPNWNSRLKLNIVNSDKVTMNGALTTNGTYDTSMMQVTVGSAQQATSVDFTNTVHADTLTLEGASTATFLNAASVRHAVNAAGGTIAVGSQTADAVTTYGSLVLKDTLSAAKLTLAEGTSATLDGAATVSGAVDNSGLLTVNNTLTLTGNSSTVKNLGKVAGTGTVIADSTNGNRVYNLSGDLSGWTGAFEQSARSGNMTLNIADTEVLNADIVNNATTSSACKLDVNLKRGMTVNGTMSSTSKGPLNVSLEGDTTFNNTVSVNNLAAAGKTVTLGSNTRGETTTRGRLTIAGTASIGSVNMADGTELTFVNQGAAISLENLLIGSGAAVSAYKGAVPTAETLQQTVDGGSSLETAIRISGMLTAGQNAALNANLVMDNGTTLAVQLGGIAMGSTVTLGTGENFELTGATVTDGALENYVLFTGVDALTLGGTAITEMGWYDASALVGSVTANGTALSTTEHSYVIGYWNGTVSLAESSVPEPATATLSLLALAALAAQRRRRR